MCQLHTCKRKRSIFNSFNGIENQSSRIFNFTQEKITVCYFISLLIYGKTFLKHRLNLLISEVK